MQWLKRQEFALIAARERRQTARYRPEQV